MKNVNANQGDFRNVKMGDLWAALRALQNNGVEPNNFLEKLRDQNFAKNIAKLILQEEVSVHQKIARLIMGKNFFGAEEWASFYGVSFAPEQIRQIDNFPWGEGTLNSACPFCGRAVKDCHFAFLGLDRINGRPLTILKLQELHPANRQPKFQSYPPRAWYSEEKFAKETTMEFRWYLLHQNIATKSEDKTYEEQKAILNDDYEMPPAVAEVTKNLLVFKKTGRFLNCSHYALCRCTDSNNHHIGVGFFSGNGGIYINKYWEGQHSFEVVAASRKPPTKY